MKELDKTKAYDLRGLSKEQRVELLNWLKVNGEGWKYRSEGVFKRNNFLGFNSFINGWNFYDYGKEILDATTLFNANKLEDLGFKPIGLGFYKLDLGNVEISVRNAVFLTDINDGQVVELLEWLTKNDKGWENLTDWGFKRCNLLGFSTNMNKWYFNDYGKEIVDATTLFEPTKLEDLGFKPIGDGFYSINLGKVVISIRNAVFVTDINDGQVVELFEYDFDKVKKLVEVWK